ncbi:hypothetical protein NPIL_670391 [Nephila pilipes]|uniref:Uncharacterized protein n=1 Tax=Nephila pilipes TaxID=299642 RepID=A0A8X6TZI4_NEPPI|nr:hypothetical protein NPIL_670391 [Nephila pilipes]
MRTWIEKNNKCLEQKFIIPPGNSKIFGEICNALNTEVILSPMTGKDIVSLESIEGSKPKKSIPVVCSVVAYKTCLALGLDVQLNTEP